LPRKLKPLAALEAGNKVVKTHHVGSGFGEFLSVFLTGASRKILLLAAHFPANGKFKILAATRADEFRLANLFLFCIKSALVHSLIGG
jgi:hypothetical protein